MPLEVFTQRNSVADIIRLKLNFILKSLFSHPLMDLRGNVRTPSIARCPSRQKWTFFRYLLRLRRHKRKYVEVGVSNGVGHFERKFQTEGGVTHQPMLTLENWSDCTFMWYQNICSALFGLDWWTNRQNYDS